ncbi:MAG TPA: hypothetical protein VJW76_10150 [Verrucomicrobiae bacterium]|nr:hypothetical protein [Verrucomicrobiae bacterium]
MKCVRPTTVTGPLPQIVLLLGSLVSSPFLSAAPESAAVAVIRSDGAAADCFDTGASTDGRFVVFASAGGNLVTNDHNDTFDVLVRDRAQGTTELVSVNRFDTGSGAGASMAPFLSSDGRYVLFQSSADDLVMGDTNRVFDVFRRDLVAGVTELVSVTVNGPRSGRGRSYPLALTPDGRQVLFESEASDLVTNDTNNAADLFVRDMDSGITALVTRNRFGGGVSSTSGGWSFLGTPQISDDGRRVVFQSVSSDLIANDTNNRMDVFVRDLAAGTNILVSVSTNLTTGNQDSWNSVISADGRFVALQSLASNLVPGDANGTSDVFVRDLLLRTTKLISIATNGVSSGAGRSFGPVINAGGRFVAFQSFANNLVEGDNLPTNQVAALDVFVRDVQSDITIRVSTNSMTSGAFSSVRTHWTGVTREERALPISISREGRFVLYQSDGRDTTNSYSLDQGGQTGGVDTNIFSLGAFIYDQTAGSRTHISGAQFPSLSDDGQYMAFQGSSVDHLPTDRTLSVNIFGRALPDGPTELISRRHSSLGLMTGDATTQIVPGAISATGRFVAYESFAANLIPSDTNGSSDVFVRDLITGSNVVIRPGTDDLGRTFSASRNPAISPDGRWLSFEAVTSNAFSAFGLSNQFNLVVQDLRAGTNLMALPISITNRPGHPATPIWSGDGRVLAFLNSLHSFPGFAGPAQIYARRPGQLTDLLVTTDLGGFLRADNASWDPQISHDGGCILFFSAARNLTTNAVSGGTNLFLWRASDGSKVLVNSPGVPLLGDAALSGDGRFVAFVSRTNLYLYDVMAELRTLMGTNASSPSLDFTGRRAVFVTNEGLDPVDTNGIPDIYVFSRASGLYALVSGNGAGTGGGNGPSRLPRISRDGRYVVFVSEASNLVGNDTNGWADVFLRDLSSGATLLLSATGNRLSTAPFFSADGSTVVFSSYAGDLFAGDFNRTKDVLVLRIHLGDADADGMADEWEVMFFNNLAREGSGDFDGDGATDLEEFGAGTSPTNDSSVLKAFVLANTDGSVSVLWSAVSGRAYRVQYKDSVEEVGWNDLPGDLVAATSTGAKPDPSALLGVQRFYRVITLP